MPDRRGAMRSIVSRSSLLRAPVSESLDCCESDRVRRVAWAVAAAAMGGLGFRLVAIGALTLDTGVGRTARPLGPLTVTIGAPRETVFDVIAGPYLGRTPRALSDEIDVLERGSDMVLAAHRTAVRRLGMVATTVETVRFSRPETVDFRLVRGPVPRVVERFTLARRRRPDPPQVRRRARHGLLDTGSLVGRPGRKEVGGNRSLLVGQDSGGSGTTVRQSPLSRPSAASLANWCCASGPPKRPDPRCPCRGGLLGEMIPRCRAAFEATNRSSRKRPNAPTERRRRAGLGAHISARRRPWVRWGG